MTIAKLSSHPYSQCYVVLFDNGTIQLVSYTTPVAEIHPNGYVQALPYFNCSATTRKQVGWFLKEYTAITYSYLKQAALRGCMVHAQNGDVIPE